jgi:hypothetical protein
MQKELVQHRKHGAFYRVTFSFVLVLVVATASCQTSEPVPVAAFSSGNSVVLVSKTGRTISTIKLPFSVGEFSFSPELKKLVVVTMHPDGAGGKMYLYSLASKQLQRIPLHAVVPESASSEVYSEPQFSEDGTELFFNTHPQAEGDLYETSGPIAELDLKSLRAKALESTIGLLTDGFMLSPNGRGFLLWDEGKVVDTNGTTLFDLHDFHLVESFQGALDEAWIGNSCVLYQAWKSANPRIKGKVSYFVLNLKTLKSTTALRTLGLSDGELDGLVSYGYPYAIVKSTGDSDGNRGGEYLLVSPAGTHTKLTSGDPTAFQILPSTVKNNLLAECR